MVPDRPLTLIAEQYSAGHRFYYVRLLIEKCMSRGDRVVVLTTRESLESAEWRAHLSQLHPEVVERPGTEFALADIQRVAAELGASLTIVPAADEYLPAALRSGWAGPGPVNLLVMRSEVQPGGRFSRMRPLKTFVKRSLMWVVGHRSRVRVLVLRSPLVSHRGPLRWVSDPVTTESSPERVRALREQLEARGCRYWLGVFGYFDARKNLPLIVEAIIDQPDVGLLAAGTMGSGVGESIAPLIARFEANGGQVVTLSGALTDAEFDSAIATVDCVVLAYSTEGTSGIALKAAALGRRLILAGGTTIRQYAAQLGDQASWSPLDVNSLAEAILTSRTLPVPEARSDFGADEFLTEVTARF